MSYTEFTYQLLQAYDFLQLFKNEGINVQIGGSDQWGNITAGTDLIRKNIQTEEAAYGLTFPLLLKNDGTKFGKSEDGAIWLSPSMLSPYKSYQYFFSVPDVDVIRFLKNLTFLSLDEIKILEDQMSKPGYVPKLELKETYGAKLQIFKTLPKSHVVGVGRHPWRRSTPTQITSPNTSLLLARLDCLHENWHNF